MNCEITAAGVLASVEKLIEELETKKKSGYGRYSVRIDDVYDDLSIFDWWKDTLSISNLKDMRTFLKKAIEFGFDGYVCFKVGVTGCANGMWAHTEKSTDGYSPSGCRTLYKSFTPAYTVWDVSDENGNFSHPSNNEAHSVSGITQVLKRCLNV